MTEKKEKSRIKATYETPELEDHGSLVEHTQTRPFDGGGPDIGSS